MVSLSLTLNGVAFKDANTGTGYIMHNACYSAFERLMFDADVDLDRFITVGPVSVETCNLASCAHTV
jgi:hypothetical protein